MKKLIFPLAIAALAVGAFLMPVSHSSAAPSTAEPLKVCRVILDGGAEATVVATGKTVTLAKGTSLTLVSSQMHQGYIAVNARVGGKVVRLSIMVEDTNCFD